MRAAPLPLLLCAARGAAALRAAAPPRHPQLGPLSKWMQEDAPAGADPVPPGPGNSSLPPVVFIAPMTGATIIATWNKTTPKVQPLCYKMQTEPYELWLSAAELVPYAIDCMFDNMRIDWDSGTKTYKTRGVESHTQKYGSAPGEGATIRPGQNPVMDSPIAIFGAIRDQLVTALGYNGKTDMAVIPYDWRRGPYQFAQPGADYDRLKQFLEDNYAKHGRSPLCISISMGGPFFHDFLQHREQAWKDKYVAGWISLGGVFGGSVDLFLDTLSGAPNNYYGIPYFPGLGFRDMMAHWGSAAFLAPIATGNASFDAAPMITTPTKTYAYRDAVGALRAAAAQVRPPTSPSAQGSLDVFLANKMDTLRFNGPPGVPAWCFYSYGVETVAGMQYVSEDLSDRPDESAMKIIRGDGDGTVPFESLKACEQWRSDAAHTFASQTFEGVGHVNMLSDPKVVNEIEKVARGMAAQPPPSP